MKKIEGTLVYVQVQEPVKAFVKAGVAPKPDEWKAGVVITDKAVKKEYEKFAKSLDTLVSIKEVESIEFEEKYKCDLPEGAGDEVWVVTLRKSTELGKTGKPVPEMYKPKVFEKQGKLIVDITNSKLVANGSKGALSLDVFEKSTGGGSIFLKNVLVTELIEYVKPESNEGEAGSEFLDDEPAEQPKVAPKTTAPAKPAAKPGKKPVFDDLDDQIPF